MRHSLVLCLLIAAPLAAQSPDTSFTAQVDSVASQVLQSHRRPQRLRRHRAPRALVYAQAYGERNST